MRPGEWRTISLFHAEDDEDLERVLGTMPLRIWRTDEVTPLVPHPNDPGRGRVALDGTAEFLTTLTLVVPPEGRFRRRHDEGGARVGQDP